MKKKISAALMGWLWLAAVAVVSAQTPEAQETESTVPALTAFHEIIYPIWHTAYPDKDYASLRSFAPEVSADMLVQAEAITKASLPKRLESKAQAFGVASQELHEATKALVDTGKSGEGEAISAAVEEVHTKYQALEKIFD